MNLSAIIAIVEGNQTLAIELVFDGHPQFAGRTLLRHYPSYDAVYTLIAEGDLKLLGDTVQSCRSYFVEDYLRDQCVQREDYTPSLIAGYTLSSYLENSKPIAELLRGGASFLYLFDADSERWLMSDKTLVLRMLTEIETV
jgi:hypothetical protein